MRRWEDHITMDPKEIGVDTGNWIDSRLKILTDQLTRNISLGVDEDTILVSIVMKYVSM